MPLNYDFQWTVNSSSDTTLEMSASESDNDLTFTISGKDGGSDPNYFHVEVTKTGDDSGSGTVQRKRTMGMLSTADASTTVPNSLTQDMLRKAEHFCRECREEFISRPPAGADSSPYSTVWNN